MLKSRLQRSLVAVFALAAVAFAASGVPDNKGTDAAIGWWAFVALALAFLVLVATAISQAARQRGRRRDAAVR